MMYLRGRKGVIAVDKVNLHQYFFDTGGHRDWAEMLCIA